MKKEVLIAIIIGFTLGLVITFGIHSARQSFQSQSVTDNLPPQASNPIPSPSAQPLTISSPDNGEIVNQPETAVTGTTSTNALLSIIGSDSYTTTPADDQGNFSGKISLQEGANLVTVKAFDPSGAMTEKTITVIYLPETNQPSPTPAG